MAAILLLFLAGLAGCSSIGTQTASMPSGSAGTSSGPALNATLPGNATLPKPPQRLELTGCTNYGGVFPVPMASATAALPSGFTPIPAANDPQGGATLYAIIVECTASKVDGNDTKAARLGYAELAVTPPANLVLDGVTDCTVPVFFASSNDEVAKALLDLGISGRAHSSSSTDVTDGMDHSYQASFTIGDATVQLTVDIAGPDTGQVASGSFMVYGVQDGKLTTILKGTSSDGGARQGPALLQAAGTPVAKDARQGALGFSAAGFSLTYERRPVP